MVSAPFDNERYRNQQRKAIQRWNCYQKVIICLAVTSAPKLCLWRRNFCAAGDVLLLLQRCDFWTVKKPFPLTTAAQNIHVFLPKLPLHKKHFFGWLKAANFSIVCGTVTLKSPPSRGTDAPRVHPRPRKRLSRCTLDCGFKTSESPAMRGFVAERGQIRGTSLYLVLKSNGPHCSKNLPVKFGFSSKTVPANIVQKLPSQRCSKPFLIPPFDFSHKRPTFALTPESGYTHSAFGEKSHTTAYAAKQGRFGWGCCHSRHEPHVPKPPLAGYQNGKLCRFWVLVRCTSEARRRRGPAGLRDLFLLLSKLQLARPALRAFCVCEVGMVSLPSVCSACCQSVPCAGVKTANLPISEVG